MPAAVAVPLIIGGATTAATVYGANKAANASKQAAQTQADYGNQALQLQRDMYTQTRSDQAPQRAISAGALNALGARTGIPMGGGSTTGSAPPTGGLSLSNMGAPPAMSPTQSGTVLMRAPNGQTKPVPREQVPYFQQRGAQVVQ